MQPIIRSDSIISCTWLHVNPAQSYFRVITSKHEIGSTSWQKEKVSDLLLRHQNSRGVTTMLHIFFLLSSYTFIFINISVSSHEYLRYITYSCIPITFTPTHLPPLIQSPTARCPPFANVSICEFYDGRLFAKFSEKR
jgi:hypothetical protein